MLVKLSMEILLLYQLPAHSTLPEISLSIASALIAAPMIKVGKDGLLWILF